MMDTFEIRDGKVIFNSVKYDFDNLPKDIIFKDTIDIRNKNISILPNMSSWIVRGDFRCYGNRLSSLIGCPKEIGGDFLCFLNKLTSLEHCPEKIGGSFDCSSNKLISLKGCPGKIRYDFNCANNKLTSLEHCPKKVGSYFDCSWNNIEIIDTWMDWFDIYQYKHNPIKSIKEGILPLKYLIEFYKKGLYNSKELLMKEFGCNTEEELKAYLLMMGKI